MIVRVNKLTKNIFFMSPLYFIDFNYLNEKISVPVDFVLNKYPFFSDGYLTTNIFSKRPKYILDIDRQINDINYPFNMLGIITDKVPTKKYDIPIFVLEKRMFDTLKDILKNQEILISINCIGFKTKLRLFIGFLFEAPQLIFLTLIFIFLMKIIPILDRSLSIKRNIKTRISKKNDTKNSCSICLENFSLYERISETICNHIYHENCFINWAKESDLCPICKRDVFDTFHMRFSHSYELRPLVGDQFR